ncbi:hypothetical protein CQA53_07405 [Helicobacter didelphidarum]|uniref:Uncharacterized protein n=1 Tax=Helicobacter didelphidarum TaxID=2040648 RepID=A0A3D8II18_9HELI|nr:hypothetical protein [Helicobacter didelphidarum]RDU64889.1 hypothetical protein CQA53_07405 [Helicobacter didelphidarum]
MLPVVIMPKHIQNFTKQQYKLYSGNISPQESLRLADLTNTESKHILCFIGGFLDTYCKVLYHIFEECILRNNLSIIPSTPCDIQYKNMQENSINNNQNLHTNTPTFNNKESDFGKETSYTKFDTHLCFMYSSFNCFDFLKDFIPNIIHAGYKFSAISHSWGAKNIIRLCLQYDFCIDTLITLDCVGHFTITHRPSKIKRWENIYITDFYGHYARENLAPIIGHGQQFISYADSNIGIPPPAHHASVSDMLKYSKIVTI